MKDASDSTNRIDLRDVCNIYHLRTIEPDEGAVDSLYVPRRQILMGFVKTGPLCGKIIDYGGRDFLKRAEDIILGGIGMGSILSCQGYMDETINKIAKSPRGEIKTTIDFNGSTTQLVGILTGVFRKKGFFENLGDFYRSCVDSR